MTIVVFFCDLEFDSMTCIFKHDLDILQDNLPVPCLFKGSFSTIPSYPLHFTINYIPLFIVYDDQ